MTYAKNYISDKKKIACFLVISIKLIKLKFYNSFFNIHILLSLTPTFIIHFKKKFFFTYAKIYISDKKKIACFLAYFYQVNLLKEKFFNNNLFFNRLVYLLFTPKFYFFPILLIFFKHMTHSSFT